MEKSKRWAYPAAYLLIAAAWFATWFQVRETFTGAAYWLAYPKMEPAEIERGIDEIVAVAQSSQDPTQRVPLMKQLGRLAKAAERGDRETTWSESGDRLARFRALGTRAFAMQGSITKDFETRFGMRAVSEATNRWLLANQLSTEPTDERWRETQVALKNLLWAVLLAMPFMVLLNLVRLERSGLSVRLELMCPDRLLFYSVVFPWGLFVYPNHTLKDQTVRAFRAVAVGTCWVFSVFGMGAAKCFAQTKADPQSDRKPTLAGQLDVRLGTTVAGSGPSDKEFTRLSLYPGKAAVDLIVVRVKGFALGNLTAGRELLNRHGLQVYGVGSFTTDSTGTTSLGEGAQVYFARPPTPRFPWLLKTSTPVLGFDHTVTGRGQTAFQQLTQVNIFPIIRLSAGAEVSTAKTLGGVCAGYAGPVLGLHVGKSKQVKVEAFGLFRDLLSGSWTYRARVVYDFSFAIGR